MVFIHILSFSSHLIKLSYQIKQMQNWQKWLVNAYCLYKRIFCDNNNNNKKCSKNQVIYIISLTKYWKLHVQQDYKFIE